MATAIAAPSTQFATSAQPKVRCRSRNSVGGSRSTATDTDDEREVVLDPTYGASAKVKLRYRLLGPVGAPIIVVQGGISADRAVCDLPDTSTESSALSAADPPQTDSPKSDPPQSWWPQIVGPGLALDTRRFQVLCLDWIAPADFISGNDDIGTDRRSCSRPSAITTADQADALAALLTELQIDRIAAYVGASYGGMVGLAFAARYPELVQQLVVISAAHRPHPLSTAQRSVQRRIVALAARAGSQSEGLALARELAMTTYRSVEEFGLRFGSEPLPDAAGFRFPVENYLAAAGESFVRRCNADRFLALSESIDLHHVNPTAIAAQTTLIAVASDRLVPIADVRELSQRIQSGCTLIELDSIFGHDAFLTEPEQISGAVRAAFSPITDQER